MNFKEMEYILAVEQEKNLTKAARKIGISQPAMSKCLRNIETELGVSLFEKNFGRVHSNGGRKAVFKFCTGDQRKRNPVFEGTARTCTI